MKYKLIGENNILDPLETILKNRGIEDTKKFLSISKKNVIPWNVLSNIEKAVDCLLKHIESKSKIFIQVDSDFDGVSSSALLINYINLVFDDVHIEWRLQKGKEHGVILETIPKDVGLVIIPDAGSSQYDEHKALSDKGIDVLVLDHHECDKESEYAIVVNNQLSPKYHNKFLSGVGIVYKFCQAIDSKLGIREAENYLDLVAMGNIADSMDLRSLETRYYAVKGLKKVNNPFLKALVKQQSYSLKDKLTIIGVLFYISPLVNATIRLGTMEEKEMMFKAFLNSDETVYYKRNDEYEPIAKFAARMAYNLKNKQNRIRDKGLEQIKARVEELGNDKSKIIICNVDGILDRTMTGLVANKVAEVYKRPALLFRPSSKNEGNVGGSARGYEKGAVKDLKKFLWDTGKFVFCEGHANAHGFEIAGENLIETNEVINELLKDTELVDYYNVDFILSEKQLNEQFILDIGKESNLWGNKVDEPVIAFQGLTVNREDIFFKGKKENTLSFKVKNIDFVKFFVKKIEIEEHLKGDSFEIDVVGKCSINEYNGKKYPQVIMEDFIVTKIKKKQLVF